MRVSNGQIAEREQQIMDLLEKSERLSVTDVANALNMPVSSARRYIQKMEQSGTIIRTYRGIIKAQSDFEEYLTDKYRVRRAEKKAIAAAARKHIEEGDIILLGGGSTIHELAVLLRDARNLHVITTSVPIAYELYQIPNLEVEMVGGIVHKQNGIVTSTQTLSYLKSIHVKKAFLGADSISIEHGITTPNYFEAEVEKLIVKNTPSVFILADHSKFNKVTLTSLAAVNEIHYFITDSATDPRTLSQIEALGPTVVRAEG